MLIGIQNGIRLLGAKQELVEEISNINSLSWAPVPVVSQDKACQDITVKLKKGKQNSVKTMFLSMSPVLNKVEMVTQPMF